MKILKLIYAADDELNIRNLIKSFLEQDGYMVEIFETGDLLYEAFTERPSDLVILDVMMPGSDGFVICSKIRQLSNVPIIMLTARDGESDYITGITLGSDDYFTKPFRPLLLSMRVKAIFRRIEMEKEPQNTKDIQLSFGNLILYPKNKMAYIKNRTATGKTTEDLIESSSGMDLTFTMTEFNLLCFLMENKGRAVGREELLNKIWGYDNIVETRVTDDTVKRLRKKMTEAGCTARIETVWGYGFRLGINEEKKMT